jgi:hypothetical protein
MRAAIAIRRSVVAVCVFACVFVATLAGEQAAPAVGCTPFEAYGVLCARVSGEAVRRRDQPPGAAGDVHGRGGLGRRPRGGRLSVVVTVERQPGRSRAAYDGRIIVQPTAFAGRGAWQGGFAGELRGADARADVLALGSELLHRRTVRVRRNPATIPVPGPPRMRTVRRVLRGAGELAGLRLSFHHPANEGVPPPAGALPAGCLGDYERWTGGVFDGRGAARLVEPAPAP